MKPRPNSTSSRILAALKLQPMTINQVADALAASAENIRVTLQRLEDGGLVRRAGFARASIHGGCTPFLWEAA